VCEYRVPCIKAHAILMRANYLLSYTWPSLSGAHVGRGCPGNFQDGDDLSYAALRNRYTHRHVATDATCMQPRRYRSHAAGFPGFCARISDRQKRPGRELAASFSRNWVSRITRERLPNGTGLTTGNRESVPSIRSLRSVWLFASVRGLGGVRGFIRIKDARAR